MLHLHRGFGLASPASSWRIRHAAIDQIVSEGFPYSRKLTGHLSCVNALAFSKGDAQFLASGGDDYRVLLWNFHQEDVIEPCADLTGPEGNVFCLAFSASNRYLFSAGVDEAVIKYDLSTLSRSSVTAQPRSERFSDHSDIIKSVAPHPFRDEEFLTAGDDGQILLYDERASLSRAQHTMLLDAQATGVQFHPVMDNVFVSSDSHGNVCLRDARMCFGPLSRRTGGGVVQTFLTKLCKPSSLQLVKPEPSSIVFDREGTKLGVTMLYFLPTIYNVSDPVPIALCSGRTSTDGSQVPLDERTYTNSCTLKHGSFGGFGADVDQYFSSGSDDFRGYVWKLPSVEELTQARFTVSADDWSTAVGEGVYAFAEGYSGERHVPVELCTPFCRLNGHMSIVNTALAHPRLPHILTSGIERHILLHSPTESSPCSVGMSRTPSNVRRIPDLTPDERSVLRADLNNSLEDVVALESEERTIARFDEILRTEGQMVDVFNIRPDDSSDDEDELEIY